MRILVFGGTGMLGHKLVQVLGRRFEVWTTIRGPFADVERYRIFDRERTIADVDVLNDDALTGVIRDLQPDVVINAVGVIKQVPEANDPVTTLGINTLFPLKLASMASEQAYRLISVSTDCVFSGRKGNYSESDEPDARDLYGLSKLLGEIKAGNCLTLRTSMIGRELNTQNSLVEWFLSNRGGRVDGWTKALYSGFPTLELAKIIGDIIEFSPDLRGLYHVSSDPISKFDLLQLLDDAYSAGVEITPSEKVVIDRSLDSAAFRELTDYAPPTWAKLVAAMAADPTPYDEFFS